MRDPHEDLDAEGFITTGARRDRVSRVYEPVLEAAIASVVARLPGNGNDGCRDAVELHLYGSVATGMARPNGSDVDLFTIGVSTDAVASPSGELSRLFAPLCRGVEIGAGQPNNYMGESDAAYGNRVFLRHYSVCLYGSDSFRSDAAFRGDTRAARGFNGDIGRCLTRWRQAALADPAPALGRRMARKTLLAVASLVSVHDSTWTTDRVSSAHRWAELRPPWAGALTELVSWSDGAEVASPTSLEHSRAPRSVVESIVEDFRAIVGLWD